MLNPRQAHRLGQMSDWYSVLWSPSFPVILCVCNGQINRATATLAFPHLRLLLQEKNGRFQRTFTCRSRRGIIKAESSKGLTLCWTWWHDGRCAQGPDCSRPFPSCTASFSALGHATKFLPLSFWFIYKLYWSLNLPIFNFNITAPRNENPTN